MLNILKKEVLLSASPLTGFFILFGLSFFLPGYPILCGAFFVTLGIFKSFQNARESNDIVFSALLPIAKRDVVMGKYLFVCLTELSGILLMAVAVIARMVLLSDVSAYRHNALMNANPFALGVAFVLFGMFNLIFVCGFFKTAYKFGRPFFWYLVVCFICIGMAESLHHFPGLGFLNAFGMDCFAVQMLLLGIGIVCFLVLTVFSYRRACTLFDRVNL